MHFQDRVCEWTLHRRFRNPAIGTPLGHFAKDDHTSQNTFIAGASFGVHGDTMLSSSLGTFMRRVTA